MFNRNECYIGLNVGDEQSTLSCVACSGTSQNVLRVGVSTSVAKSIADRVGASCGRYGVASWE